MKNKKRFLLTFLIVILSLTLVMTAVACDNTDKNPEEKPEVNELFTNGSFISVTGDTYPKAPTSWTASPGSTSSSSDVATPSGTDNISAGVISVNDSEYRANKKEYGNVNNPLKPNADKDNDNILMIYNKSLTSYKYSSTSISLDKSKYYKLSVNVKTVGIEGNSGDNMYGAYIYVKGDSYARFEAIDTAGEWKTYTTYIESSRIKNSSISVELSLGVGDKSTGHMTKGHAYFSDIQLTDLTDIDEEKGEVAFNANDFAQVAKSSSVAKYSMLTPDADMDYVSATNVSPATPAKWNGVAGFGSGDSAQSGSVYVEKGIIDNTFVLTDADGKTIDFKTSTDNSTARMLYIKNKQATAYGYRASVAMRVDNSTTYKISIKVRTVLKSGKVTLKLTDGTNTDERDMIIKDIDTAGQWEEYSFIIQGNDFRTNDLYLETWLGQGGKNQTDTHAVGVAMFDDVKLEKVDNNDYNEGLTGHFSLKSKNPPAPIDLNNFMSANYEDSTIASDSRTTTKVVNTEDWANSGFKCDNPSSSSASDKNILVVNNKVPSAYTLSTVAKNKNDTTLIDNTIPMLPNSYYLVSMWVKTLDITKGKGLNVSLFSYDNELTANDDYDKAINVLKTISNFNSEDFKSSDDSSNNNGYTELKFYVQTHQMKNKSLGLQFSLGSGSATQSENHVMGYAFVSHLSSELISSSDYSNASTSTTVQSVALKDSAESSEVASNGMFNFIDISTTNSIYKDKATAESKTIWENGMLKDYLGAPLGWTISNQSALKEGNSRAGIFNMVNQEAIRESIIGLDSNPAYTTDQLNVDKLPNVLALKNSDSSYYLGYTSSAISLSANSYYLISVWAKADIGNYYSINLTSTSNLENVNLKDFNQIQGTGNWTQHFVYVQTGMTSASVKLGLYAGYINDSESDYKQDNEVYFTNTTFTTITEKAYNLKDEAQGISMASTSWFVDRFDEYTENQNALSKPKDWTAQTLNSEITVDNNTIVSGVFSQTSGNWNLINIDPDKDAIKDKMFSDSTNENIFMLYNKIAAAYQYNSASASLSADTYYRIKVSMLTYGLENGNSATLTLKINNKTYRFGKLNPTTDIEKAKVINTSTYGEDGKEIIGDWKDYYFYVKTEKNVTASATLSIGLGYDKDNQVKGYVFADNFSVEKIDEKDFIPTISEGEDADPSQIAEKDIPTNFRIVFTSEDAKAQEEEPPTEDKEPVKNDLMWLWITSGVVGGVMIIVVVVYLIQKFAPKKKKSQSLTKGKKRVNKDKRDQFNK